MDTKNKELDQEYADKLISAFRKQTHWKVEEGTRIHTELLEFSKGYSKKRRDPIEVVMIFCLANNIEFNNHPPKAVERGGV